MRGPIFFLLILLAMYVAWHAALPWTDNYFLTSSLEGVAQYGTKHNPEATLKELKSVLVDKGYENLIHMENVSIEKDDETRVVLLTVEYTDTMTIFGVEIMPVDFVISLQAAFVASRF